MQVAPCLTNISCITQVYNSGLHFSHFEVFIQFSADENGLDISLNFYPKDVETLFNKLRRVLVFEW